jgi:signal peptidase I|tara:strand:+ start:6204 stop:7901 length:1698 start_codon:yes stop_codon:yes gene_type:complete
MTFTQWFLFFIAIQVIHFLGTWKLYVKAGRKAWEAIIPIYNGIVLMQIINRPKWWVLLLFVPVVNLLMFLVIWIETIRTFGFYRKVDSLLVIATLGGYIFYINYATEAIYNAKRSIKPRSELGEWVSSITFAIIAATLVHTYFMQPFTIPSSSLEKSLLVGDYLFVSKFHYGARIPSTVIAAPMVHDSLPFTSSASYLNKPQLPYLRVPGFQKIKNNDIVCFNWPADSLKTMWGDNSGEFTYKPVDKKTNYVKRCVAIAGDTLEIRDGFVFINGEKNSLPDRAKLQFKHTVYSSKGISTEKVLRYIGKEFESKFIVDYKSNEEFAEMGKHLSARKALDGNKFRVNTYDYKSVLAVAKKYNSTISEIKTNKRIVNLTLDIAKRLRKDSEVDSVVQIIHEVDNAIFPQIDSNEWSQDNMGPIYVPKKGVTININTENLPYYQQIIELYEYNNLVTNNGIIYINGKKADTYTFQQDYYWLMGDNRHNSLDSRYWGFVPFDHVLGKPVMVWFSWEADASTFMAKLKSIRWSRMFTTVGGEGEPVSYRYVALGLLLLYFGYSFIKKKKTK